MNSKRGRVGWAALLVSAVVVGCGGGGGGGGGSDDGGGQTSNLPDVPSGYVKYRVHSGDWDDMESKSISRISFDRIFELCNQSREMKGAARQEPLPEELLYKLSNYTSEEYYDAETGAARRDITWDVPVLTYDPNSEAVPDCRAYRLHYGNKTDIWLRDGRRAKVEYDTKTGKPKQVTMLDGRAPDPKYPDWPDNLPTKRIVGQTCLEVPVGLGTGSAGGVCQWSAYKEVEFRNLPMALEIRTQILERSVIRATFATTDRAQFGAYATKDIDALPDGVPVK